MLEKVVFVPLRQDKLQLMDTLAVAGVELVTFRLRDFFLRDTLLTTTLLLFFGGLSLIVNKQLFFHDSIIIPRLFLFVHVFDYTEINPAPGHGAQPTA